MVGVQTLGIWLHLEQATPPPPPLTGGRKRAQLDMMCRCTDEAAAGKLRDYLTRHKWPEKIDSQGDKVTVHAQMSRDKFGAC